jgi:hypothetical protein
MRKSTFLQAREFLFVVVVFCAVVLGPLHCTVVSNGPAVSGIGRLGRDLLRRVTDESSKNTTAASQLLQRVS